MSRDIATLDMARTYAVTAVSTRDGVRYSPTLLLDGRITDWNSMIGHHTYAAAAKQMRRFIAKVEDDFTRIIAVRDTGENALWSDLPMWDYIYAPKQSLSATHRCCFTTDRQIVQP